MKRMVEQKVDETAREAPRDALSSKPERFCPRHLEGPLDLRARGHERDQLYKALS